MGRVLMLVVVLGVALVATRSCATDGDVTSDEAIEIAQAVQVFEPDDIQVRFFRQGVPKSVPLWAVSLYQGTATAPTKVRSSSSTPEPATSSTTVSDATLAPYGAIVHTRRRNHGDGDIHRVRPVSYVHPVNTLAWWRRAA